MVARIAGVEFSILYLGAFVRAVRLGVVGLLSFARIITSCKGCRAILRFPFLLIKKWFSFGILLLLHPMVVDPVLAFVVIARLYEVYWTALGDQRWFS